MSQTSQKCSNIPQHHCSEALICIVKYFWMWHLPNPLFNHIPCLARKTNPKTMLCGLQCDMLLDYSSPRTCQWPRTVVKLSMEAMSTFWWWLVLSVLDVGVEHEVLTHTMVRNEGENNDCHRWQFAIFHFHQLSHHFQGHTPCITLFLPVQNIYLWLPNRPWKARNNQFLVTT